MKDDPQPLVFQGSLSAAKEGKLALVSTPARGFALDGHLWDKNDRTYGLLHLIEAKTNDSVEISYRAYKARIKVSEKPSSQPLGSTLECRVKILRETSFAWTHNWSVVRGPSFFVNDFVTVTDSKTQPAENCTPPEFTLRGESKQTHVAPAQNIEYELEVPPNDTAAAAKLIENPETGDRRVFEVTLQDQQNTRKNDVVIEVESETPDEEPVVIATPTPAPDPTLTPTPPPRPAAKPAKPTATRPAASKPEPATPQGRPSAHVQLTGYAGGCGHDGLGGPDKTSWSQHMKPSRFTIDGRSDHNTVVVAATQVGGTSFLYGCYVEFDFSRSNVPKSVRALFAGKKIFVGDRYGASSNGKMKLDVSHACTARVNRFNYRGVAVIKRNCYSSRQYAGANPPEAGRTAVAENAELA
ncbi:MAG: hypothetical protein HC902_01130 [Calothrix sp. SM1_5_4]|nr:hypothetical protein [Calothrix sp. SM1_5_4]